MKNTDINDVFDKLDALNPEATYLSESALSNVDTWYDTGCYALNAIVSGRCKGGGVPKGRIVGFSGPSGAGKTLIMNKILANAQHTHGTIPVIFDSEFAVDAETGKNAGLDPERTKYVPVNSVEQCRNQLVTFLDSVVEKKLHGRFMVAIDSLGNLASQKEINDVEKDKAAMDMGLRAKTLKAMLRLVTYKAAAAGVTVLFSNHTYDDPSAMYPSLVKQQAGGSGPIYMSSILCQIGFSNEKQDENNEEDEMLAEARNYSGKTLRFLTTKNRFIPQYLQAEVYLNFKTGLDKYSGLKDMAINHGVLISNGPTFQIGVESADGKYKVGDKLGYYKNWRKDAEFWENYIIPELDKKLAVAYRYGSLK